jgi:recombinational DNA repair ATPase RecF
MRIIHFFSENYKRLKVVEFDPDKNMVVISGKNGQGKSSVLDAIWSTFKYAAAKKKVIEPVRHGEDRAKTVIVMDDYTITRTFKGDDSTLRIETNDGTIVKSPQALLDKIVGDLSFDPLVFANAKDADRRQILRDIFALNLSDFDAKDFELKEQRLEKGRELKALDGRLRSLKPPTEHEPADEISASDLIRQMTEIASDSEKISNLRNRIKDMTNELNAILTKHNGNDLKKTLISLKEQIDNIEVRNARAREITEYMRIRKLHDSASGDLDKLKSKIELNKIERDEAIESANIPINGLKIREDGVFIHDIPFDQISQSEKIKASLSIAIAANPELRVIRIIDGSLLDSESMSLVGDIAKEHDMQIWIERVADSNDSVGVIIEDGEIKTINA